MEINGKNPLFIPAPQVHESDKAENKADEVQGQKTEESKPVVPMGPVDISPAKLEEISQSDRPADVVGVLEAADPDSITGFRRGVQEKLVALAATDFTPAQQKEFTRYLDRNLTYPDDMGRLAWVKAKVWYLVRKNKDVDVSVLNAYFRDKGLRLLPWEKLPEKNPGFQVDRAAYRERIKEVLPSGKIDRRTALDLLDRCKSVVDVDDLFWCQLQISRYVDNGKLEFADAKTEKMVRRFFEGRLEGRVGMAEWGWELRRLRQSDFTEANVAKVEGLIEACADDADALFYAKRQLAREAKKAIAQAEKKPAAEQKAAIEHIKEVQASLTTKLDAKVEGQFDRYVVEKRIESMARKGKIDKRKLMALQAAVTTSKTHEDFVYGAMTVQVQLALIEQQNAIMAAWNDMLEELEEDRQERQEEARIVEQEYQERVQLERQLERLRLEPVKIKELGERAWLRGGRQRLLNQLVGERDPSRRAGIESALAQRDVELNDLEQPLEPRT